MNAFELVDGALEALEAARVGLEDLRRHIEAGAPAAGAVLIASSVDARLGVAAVRIRAAVRAAGGSRRWRPGDAASG